MAKVTWNGNDTTTQWGLTFKKGEAVDVADPAIWTRAQGDPSFKVEVPEPKAPPKAKEPAKPVVDLAKPATAKNDDHASKR